MLRHCYFAVSNLKMYFPGSVVIALGIDIQIRNYNWRSEKVETRNARPQRATESIEAHREIQDILCGPPFFSLWLSVG
jgi:hypothetical protein